MLVTANNFLQLFFGWEAVGLVSYLLIGFWFEKDAAIEGNLKAFLVNRVGDFGFILGIALVLVTVGSLDYDTVFAQANLFVNSQYHLFPNTSCTTVSLVCVLLFIGAMGKSAQMPLHVWLPESMQGPTPISALIHAATMVTAGVFMVARLSPLYELSQPALSLILMIGASGALYLGLLAFVSYDIKRIIAYSTMSQLGYMMAANGASAFQAGIFHLVTHACFKALLFLAAGSVMLMTKDEHDIRQLGGLRKYMPITYVTFLLGALSLSAIPPFSGFYSKDAIIDAVHVSSIPGAQYAYVCLLIGSFVTAFYIFREFFMVFHGQERMSADVKIQLREAPLAITAPLMLLAIPSVLLGAFLVYPTWYQFPGLADYRALTVFSLPVGLACGGIFSAWIWVLACPALARWTEEHFKLFQWMLKKQYGFDAFNDFVFVKGGRRLSEWLYHYIDITLIDTWFVDGTGREVVWLSRLLRRLQSGYV